MSNPTHENWCCPADTSPSTYCKRFQMIVGILTLTEYYQGRGQVPPSSRYWTLSHPQGHVVLEEIDEDSCDVQHVKEDSATRAKNGLRRKPKLDNVRKLRGIYYIDPEDEESNETLKNAWKKLEMHVGSSVLCKFRRTWRNSSLKAPKGPSWGKSRWARAQRKIRGDQQQNEQSKTIRAHKYDAHETTRSRVQETHKKGHEDHIAERLLSAMNHCNHAHKPTPIPRQWRYWTRKPLLTKSGTNRKNWETGHSANLLDFLPSEECSIGGTPSKNSRSESCSGWTTSNTKVDRQPFSLSKVHRRHRWQRQNVWDTIPNFPVCLERRAMQFSAYTQAKMIDSPLQPV